MNTLGFSTNFEDQQAMYIATRGMTYYGILREAKKRGIPLNKEMPLSNEFDVNALTQDETERRLSKDKRYKKYPQRKSIKGIWQIVFIRDMLREMAELVNVGEIFPGWQQIRCAAAILEGERNMVDYTGFVRADTIEWLLSRNVPDVSVLDHYIGEFGCANCGNYRTKIESLHPLIAEIEVCGSIFSAISKRLSTHAYIMTSTGKIQPFLWNDNQSWVAAVQLWKKLMKFHSQVVLYHVNKCGEDCVDISPKVWQKTLEQFELDSESLFGDFIDEILFNIFNLTMEQHVAISNIV